MKIGEWRYEILIKRCVKDYGLTNGFPESILSGYMPEGRGVYLVWSGRGGGGGFTPWKF